ncbi:hypothetical protein GCM10027199_50510 [Amycolatopsis magusensis]
MREQHHRPVGGPGDGDVVPPADVHTRILAPRPGTVERSREQRVAGFRGAPQRFRGAFRLAGIRFSAGAAGYRRTKASRDPGIMTRSGPGLSSPGQGRLSNEETIGHGPGTMTDLVSLP